MKLAILGTSQAIDRDVSPCRPSKRLLFLISDGYEIVIITTRTKLFPEDDCWRSLVKEENIYFPIGRVAVGDSSDPAYSASWEVVFRRFGLVPPIEGSSWLRFRAAAGERCIAIY